MADNCIVVEQLTKRYAGATVDSVNKVALSIKNGVKYGVLGPNGAGKTTLISMLCGLLEPTSGQISYWNEPLDKGFKNIKVKIGFVPQDFAFYQELTPVQNLEYFGAMYKLNASQIATRTDHILRVLGLEDVKHKKIETFSGGMKRRVNLAIGIIHEPSVLFLDEPTVGVDIQSKAAIIRFLNELNANGMTIVYTSHHLEEAEEFCDQIALIDLGKIIMKGNTKELLTSHQASGLKELFLKYTGEAYRD